VRTEPRVVRRPASPGGLEGLLDDVLLAAGPASRVANSHIAERCGATSESKSAARSTTFTPMLLLASRGAVCWVYGSAATISDSGFITPVKNGVSSLVCSRAREVLSWRRQSTMR